MGGSWKLRGQEATGGGGRCLEGEQGPQPGLFLTRHSRPVEADRPTWRAVAPQEIGVEPTGTPRGDPGREVSDDDGGLSGMVGRVVLLAQGGSGHCNSWPPSPSC